MTDFDRFLSWRLLPGSHNFPGPDGGTCINEAAIVAAGFPYMRVTDADDMPACFSRVISAYVLRLNDNMPDCHRQRLLPYVARLAGTADVSSVERKRAEVLAMRALGFSAEDAAVDVRACPHLTVNASCYAHAYHARYRMGDHTAWDDALHALDDALAIGNHAPDCDIALVRDRLEAAKQPVPA